MEFYLCPEWVNERVHGWILRHGFAELHSRDHLGYFVSNLLLIALIPLVPLLPHICLMQTLLGIPCPGCGVTHALLLAFTFHIRASLAANPAGLVVALTIGFQLAARPWAMVDERVSPLVSRVSRWLGTASVVCLMVVWTFVLFRIALTHLQT